MSLYAQSAVAFIGGPRASGKQSVYAVHIFSGYNTGGIFGDLPGGIWLADDEDI